MPRIKFTNKQLRQLLILVSLVIVCYGVMLMLDEIKSKTKQKNSNNKIILENIAPPETDTKINPKPFVEEKTILDKIKDDKYLRTEPFYYLMHKAITISNKQIKNNTNPGLGWNSLVTAQQRNKIRGKIIKIRGTLVGIQKHLLNSKYAKQRGIQGKCYWQGGIYNAQAQLFLFAVTQFPQNIPLESEVALSAMFLKVWVYKSRAGNQTYAPFFIGKKLTYITPDKKAIENIKQFEWVIGIILLMGGIIFFTSMRKGRRTRRRPSQKKWQQYLRKSRSWEKEKDERHKNMQ